MRNMRNMTKRDIADIVLVWMGLSFAHSFLNNLAFLLARIFTEETPTFDWGPSLALSLFQIVVVFLMTFILLFKRYCVLNLVFPLASQTEITVSDSCAALTDLSFWIRLLGTFTLIQSFIKVFATLASHIKALEMPQFGSKFIWSSVIPPLVSIPIAILVVWQANRIASILNKLGKSNKWLENIDANAPNSQP
jgi:hypothetical protein